MSGENAFYTILVYVTDDAAGGLKSDFNFLEHFDTFKDSTGNDAGGKICYAIVCYILT